jgi:hypothetical protein
MEGCCSTGQSPQWAVVPVEEEDIIRINVVIIIRLVEYFVNCAVYDRPATNHPRAQCYFTVT